MMRKHDDQWRRDNGGPSARGHEAGNVSPFVVIMVIPLIVAVGLVHDGGRLLAERRDVTDVAQQAALAGVQAIDVGVVRRGGVEVASGAAVARAHEVVEQRDLHAEVYFDGNSIVIEVFNEVDMHILGVVGIKPRTVTGSARAQIVRGVEVAERRQGG